MPTLESQKQANKKYDQENTRLITLKLNKKTDKDILDKFDTVPNRQGYVKNLVRADMGENTVGDYPGNLINDIYVTADVKESYNSDNIDKALDLLKVEEKTALTLVYKEGMTREKAAVEMGITTSKFLKIEESATKKMREGECSKLMRNVVPVKTYNKLEDENKKLRNRIKYLSQDGESRVAAYAIQLTDIGLPERAVNILADNDIYSLGDVAERTPNELASIKGMGLVYMEKLVDAMNENGLVFTE